ncbi:hypothetical protein P22_1488 [Propionispora sp. 2/2-37]|uniref:M48 family metallopeptidase n=1 Tax=Propionispora sp. 2/2-37 TaxID=1677858 RepID=UPI0006C28CEC|nr:M48 family metallopeptidase [Propionispora sp. 2/2-37]CUH95417.1 hypothetical protein P22_1488 [Propionispora sp. 2/2-37]
MSKLGMRLVFSWLFGMVVWLNAFYLPVAQAALIGTQDEIELGRNVAKQVEKQYGLVDDQELQDRVDRIGKSMVAVCDRPDLPYTFKVLNSKEVNAFAVPGGFIYVYKGLIDLMPSDDELAGVIGHEIGHVVKRHSVRQIEKSLGMGILFGVLFGDRGVLLQNLAYNAIMAGYSRSDENEADYLGFLHSYRAGYNPYSMVMGLKKLSELDQKYRSDLFSDHPESQARIKNVQMYAEEKHIRPTVVELAGGAGAQVTDGNWVLPPISAEYAGYKPIYRAYFVAGNLYRIGQSADYNPDHYVLDYDGDGVTVYYDDRAIITLTPQDAAAKNMTVMELSTEYLKKLKEWRKQ